MEVPMHVYVVRKDHANMDSLPFRFGVHFKRDTFLEVSDVSDRREDSRRADRFHVNANFRDPDSPNGPVHRGHFVLLAGSVTPMVVTVWRTEDVETETHLSELIRNLRRDGIVAVDDLLRLHPEHVSGRLRSAAQLFARLLSDRTEADRGRLDVAAQQAREDAQRLLDEIAEANRAADAAKEHARVEAAARAVAEKARHEAEELAYSEIHRASELQTRVESLEQQLLEERRRATDEGNSVVVTKPDILVRVNQGVLYRGSSCTELVMGDGSHLYMKTSTFDPLGRVTTKAKSLEGQRVRTTCWDPYNAPGKWSSQGYFRNVYPVPN